MSPPAPATTGSPATRALGLVTLAGLVLLLLFAFWWSPADVNQKDLVRLLYVHVPVAIWSFAACGLTTIEVSTGRSSSPDGGAL